MEIINPLGLTAVEMVVQATKRGTVITSLKHTVFRVSFIGLTHVSLQTTSETDRLLSVRAREMKVQRCQITWLRTHSDPGKVLVPRSVHECLRLPIPRSPNLLQGLAQVSF